jgi:3-oxoacyl-[acyl-carrier protein] reductase
MDFGLHGRTALVCSSTAGLGLGAARALAAEGARVAVCGRDAGTAAAVAATLPAPATGRPPAAAASAPGSSTPSSSASGTAVPAHVGLAADLSEEDAGARLAAAAEEAAGPVDVLVLNGPGPRPGAAAELTWDAAGAAIDLLLRPHIALVRALLPGMRARGWGRIVAVGSSGVVAPLEHLVASNLGRSALQAYLKTLAQEVAGAGVTVNMVLPGRIATDRVASLDAAAADRTGRTVAEVESESVARIPAGRYGTIDEFGAAVAFLASTQASYITGVSLRCDGGLIRSI